MNFHQPCFENASTSETLLREQKPGLLTAGNEVSEEPIPFDADTPDSQHAIYSWSNRDLQTLQNHLRYHDEMKTFISLAMLKGPDCGMSMPKQPKPSLKSMFDKPKPKKNLMGMELHEYLITYLVNFNDINVGPWNPTSLDSVKATLQAGFHIMKQHHGRTFNHYLHFGKILNHAFDYFSVCKLREHVPHDLTWAKWLEDNVGISISYSKQLRSIAKDFGAYNGFYFLGISFSEFLKRKEHIRLMFAEFPELDQYWRNVQL